MQNIKASVVSALRTYTALTTLVSDRIYFHYPNNFQTLPCISYFELNNAGAVYADDTELASEIVYRVDLWGNDSLSAIAQLVDIVMKTENFVRIGSVDLFEQATKIQHKSMTYQNMYIDSSF
jgi:hypothetical protein